MHNALPLVVDEVGKLELQFKQENTIVAILEGGDQELIKRGLVLVSFFVHVQSLQSFDQGVVNG